MKQSEDVFEFTFNSSTIVSIIKGKISTSATFVTCKDQEYGTGKFPCFHNFKSSF